jgi:tetratricopeptide (TPR) repeat protein
MLRGLFLFVVAILATVPALAAGDTDICIDTKAEASARLAACERVIADEKITGKPKAEAYWVRGDSFVKKRDYDKAIIAFNASLDANPDAAGSFVGRGWAHSQKGDDDHAMEDFNRALKLRPNFAIALNNRGTIFLRQGALQSALDDFNAALKSDPNQYYAHHNRGHVLMISKDYEGALAEFAEAERINPAAVSHRNYRCQVYTALRQFDKALAECNSVLEKEPKQQYATASRGDIYLAKGDLDAALKDYNAVLNINPNNMRAHLGRGRLFEQRRNPAQARADYRSASLALTKFDDIDTAMARATARERLAVLTSQVGAGNARRVALIVGNGAYKNVPALANPPRDATLVAAALRDVGFQTVTLSNDLGRDKFFEALHAFAAEAEKADWAVVYYAGHGIEIGGVNYLVPVDARLAVDRDAETQMVALEQIIAAVGGARKLRLVLLDACRDNPFEKNMQRTISLKLVDKGFSNIEPGAGFMVVYAAKHGETAQDGDGANSPFATALAREIRAPKVEVRRMFDIVRDDVWIATKHAQQPFTYGSPSGRDDFYFVAGK